MTVVIHKIKMPNDLDKELWGDDYTDYTKARVAKDKIVFLDRKQTIVLIGPIYNTEKKEWEKGNSVWISIVEENQINNIIIPENFSYQVNIFQHNSNGYTILK